MSLSRFRVTCVVGVVAALAFSLTASTASAAAAQGVELQDFGVSPAVADLGPSASSDSSGGAARLNPLGSSPRPGTRGTGEGASSPSDPLAARGSATARTPAPSAVFDGSSNPFACGTCSPPDTTGDVGPNHYVQVVNATKVAIYNKAGTLLEPAFDLSTLFSSGSCSTSNDGDPQVLYDSIADRWLLAQFVLNGGGGPFFLCFAISQTPDPTGAYFTYAFSTPELPDYFKVGVWPNGYYVSDNESTYTAYAFDRAKMLAGDPTASGVRFPGQTNLLLPADVDGPRTPGSGDPGLFYTFKDSSFPDHGVPTDRIELFAFSPNFATPASSTFTSAGSFDVAPFTYTVCGFFNLSCIPQAGTAEKVDAVSEWPMQRLAYRRFGDHQALVGNFTVGGGSASPGAAPRWFELRNTGAAWSLFQEGTYDPGSGLNRFMGSTALDVQGDLALGYSASSSTAFPSIRYATRAPGDPAGTLGAEQVMKAGGGSQTSLGDRWGDYSSMTVDPADDCTFWYTNQYYSTTSLNSWKTAIGNFKVPGCADTDHDGIADAQDACPTTPDLNTTDGCPPNNFTIGKKKLNKKKGTATIQVTVPGAGELALSGKSLKPQRPAHARSGASKPVSAAGTFKLKVVAKGKAKKQLKKKGKAKVKPKITFTPTGGLSNTETTKVKLKRKRKR